MRADVTVVKLGGSFAGSALLRNWLDALSVCAGKIVLVPGGGPFADTVRRSQADLGFDDQAANRMALLAMEQYACALASLQPALRLANSAAAIRRALRDQLIPVWTPLAMLSRARDVPETWDVTSDALAAWLAGRLKASRIVLIKSVQPDADPIALTRLVEGGIVDRAFPNFLKASGADAFVAGPREFANAAHALRTGAPTGARIMAG